MGVQVRTATFGGEGQSLPIIERQFISFSWGGKNIEDFDLLVVFDDRLSKGVYASFNDTTSNYTYIDGQIYWGTTMSAGELNFTLATDGMDSKTYEEFKAYFKPGIARRLILSEYPFRYSMARISSPPEISMLPFEKKITTEYGTFRTTEYKGEITLNFVMDDPFWYNTEDAIYFTANNLVKEEVKKDIYETGTPILTEGENIGWYANGAYWDGTTIQRINNGFASENITKLYYCGTSEGLPIIQAEYPVKVEASTSNPPYLSEPYSGYLSAHTINNITIGQNQMLFTLPPLLAGYSQALKVVADALKEELDLIETKARLREQITNSVVRKYAITCLDAVASATATVMEDKIANAFWAGMKNMFNTNSKIILIFNSQTGEITCQYLNIVTEYQGSVIEEYDVIEYAGSCLKSAFLTIPARDEVNKGVFIVEAPNATALQIDYNYRFY